MIIDGKNIATEYGMTLLRGSYDSLFKYPARKKVDFSDYAERDGIIPDLRKFEFEPRGIVLNFAVKHNNYNDFITKYETFFSHITEAGYRNMIFENGMQCNLRYDKTTAYRAPFVSTSGFSTFTLNFIEDVYSGWGVGNGTLIGTNIQNYYIIDGIDFGNFGVYPDGNIGEVLKYPDVKPSFTDGLHYDTDTVKLKHKEINIPLYMTARTKQEFLTNHAAFISCFKKTGKQLLFIKEINAATYVYYLDCTSFNVHWTNQPIAKFSIRLMIPVVTWIGRGVELWTLLLDPSLNMLLGDEHGRALAVKVNSNYELWMMLLDTNTNMLLGDGQGRALGIMIN